MDILRKPAQRPFPDDAVSVKSYGFCGSSQTMVGSISSGAMNVFTTTNIGDFAVDQDILITNAGSLTSLKTPTTGGSSPDLVADNNVSTGDQAELGKLSIAYGSTGTYTYGYRIAAIDSTGAYTAASSEVRLTICQLTLSDPMTFVPSYHAFGVSIWNNFDSNAVAYAVYRTTLPSGSNAKPGFIGLYTYGGAADTGYLDSGQAVVTPPNGIPVTPPTVPGGGYLKAKIQSVSYSAGIYSITLSVAASNQVSNVVAYHDDIRIIQQTLDSGASNVYFPSGIYRCSQETHFVTAGQVVYGDGANSILMFNGVTTGISIQASDVVIRNLHIDGNMSCVTGIASDGVPPGTSINDLTIEDCKFTNILQQAISIQNPNTDSWERVTIRGNTAIDTCNGYMLFGNWKYISISDNKQDFTQFNYAGRGICLRNNGGPSNSPQNATISSNVIRNANHTASITIEGGGKVSISNNVLLPAGGIYAIYLIGDAEYEGMTDYATITGNYMEALWPGTGVAICVNNYKIVTGDANVINNFGYGFEVDPGSVSGGSWVDSLSNGIRFSNNVLNQLNNGPVSAKNNAPLSVKYTDNVSFDTNGNRLPLNPVGIIAPPGNPLVSGVAYLNTSNVDVTIYQQVYAQTAGTDGTVVASTGTTTSTGTTLMTKRISGSTTNSSPETVTVRIPQGWYYQFTTAGSVLSTTTIFGD